jgi:beta-ureidopropionase
MEKVKAGLIQMSLKGETVESPEQLRRKMIEAHIPFIEQAGRAGVNVLCFQEVFNQPYFCPSNDAKWYAGAERVPDGPTVRLMQEYAKKYAMVIVAPLYEEDITGVYYNTSAVIDADGKYLGKYRKTHIPQVGTISEKLFFRPGNSGWPVFQTACCKLAVYTCYDRHFPEGWRALALNGAEYIVNPSATWEGLSSYLWKLEQPAAAVANGIYVGTINRVGSEPPWDNLGRFYGSSYIVNPRGQILVEASDERDELVIAEMDMSMVREVRTLWQFFNARRPETYGPLTEL